MKKRLNSASKRADYTKNFDDSDLSHFKSNIYVKNRNLPIQKRSFVSKLEKTLKKVSQSEKKPRK